MLIAHKWFSCCSVVFSLSQGLSWFLMLRCYQEGQKCSRSWERTQLEQLTPSGQSDAQRCTAPLSNRTEGSWLVVYHCVGKCCVVVVSNCVISLLWGLFLNISFYFFPSSILIKQSLLQLMSSHSFTSFHLPHLIRRECGKFKLCSA